MKKEIQECLVMSPSHINPILFKAKLTHITENSANISILRLSSHKVSGNLVFLNKVFRLFS